MIKIESFRLRQICARQTDADAQKLSLLELLSEPKHNNREIPSGFESNCAGNSALSELKQHHEEMGLALERAQLVIMTI